MVAIPIYLAPNSIQLKASEDNDIEFPLHELDGERHCNSGHRSYYYSVLNGVVTYCVSVFHVSPLLGYTISGLSVTCDAYLNRDYIQYRTIMISSAYNSG